MLYRFRPIILKIVAIAIALAWVIYAGQRLLADSRTVVAGTGGSGVVYWNVYQWSPVAGPDSAHAISALGVGAGNQIWAGTVAGGVYYWNGSWQDTHASVFGGNRITALVNGPSGQMWASSYGGGVAYYNGTAWTVPGGVYPGADPDVNALALYNSHIWAGTQTQGIWYWNGTAWTDSGFKAKDPLDPITTMFTDRAGITLWIGTRFSGSSNNPGGGTHGGVWYYKSSVWTHSNPPENTTSTFNWNSVQTIGEDVYQDIYVGTDNGVYYTANGSLWTSVGATHNPSDNGFPGQVGQVASLTGFVYGPRGNLWAGTPTSRAFEWDYDNDWIAKGYESNNYIGPLVYANAP